jgi:hypothetical protein
MTAKQKADMLIIKAEITEEAALHINLVMDSYTEDERKIAQQYVKQNLKRVNAMRAEAQRLLGS